MYCYMDGDCASLNVKQLQNGINLCELSDSNEVIHPARKDEQGIVYTSLKVRTNTNVVNHVCLIVFIILFDSCCQACDSARGVN